MKINREKQEIESKKSWKIEDQIFKLYAHEDDGQFEHNLIQRLWGVCVHFNISPHELEEIYQQEVKNFNERVTT
jgi:hypothetical protein